MSGSPDPLAIGVRTANLVESGSRESTYKLATLLAICHHAVEFRSEESSRGLDIDLATLADRVIEIYWRQLEPFADGDASPLRQVSQGQAAILREIAALRRIATSRHGASTIWRARHLPEYDLHLKRIAAHVARYPLAHLQRGDKGRSHDPLLFDDSSLHKKMSLADLDAISWKITLKPGIAAALSAVSPLLIPFLEATWVQDVARWNGDRVRESAVERYLFGMSRTTLDAVRGPLVAQQDGRCFYCRERMGEVHIDHVIPWSRCGLDDLANLVAADRRCNLDKSSSLPAGQHIVVPSGESAFTRSLQMSAGSISLNESVALAFRYSRQALQAFESGWLQATTRS